MSVESHEIHEQDVGAYVLGALSEGEATRFIRHLRECPVCRDEVDRLQFAVDALPRSVTPLAAPASMKAAVMGQVQADVDERNPDGLGRRLLNRLPRLPTLPAKVASVTAAVLLLVGIAGGFGLSQLTTNAPLPPASTPIAWPTAAATWSFPATIERAGPCVCTACLRCAATRRTRCGWSATGRSYPRPCSP